MAARFGIGIDLLRAERAISAGRPAWRPNGQTPLASRLPGSLALKMASRCQPVLRRVVLRAYAVCPRTKERRKGAAKDTEETAAMAQTVTDPSRPPVADA